MSNKTIKFIYVGRLVEEKGVDLILHAVERLADQYGDRFQIDIFGDGPLRDAVEAEEQKRDIVTFHGYQPKSKLMNVWQDAHYTLMPSRFLETFGLVALESLSIGVPVVGYHKGGLKQFIFRKHDISGRSVENALRDLIDNFSLIVWESDCHEAKNRFATYSSDRRLNQFKKLSNLQAGSRVLLVSDYAADIGGIESVLFQIKELLTREGYDTHIIGKNDASTHSYNWWDLSKSVYNIGFDKALRQKVADFQPDLLWRHSVLRYIGRFPLARMSKWPCQQRVMYHDLGLFHPYPSKVYTMSQLERSKTFGGYIKEGMKGSLLQKMSLIQKWYLSKHIRNILQKQMDLHLVPSPYMEELLDWYYPQQQITTLPHFFRLEK